MSVKRSANRYEKDGEEELPDEGLQQEEEWLMKVPAPKGYHWMKQGDGSMKVMKDPKEGFKKHKGASKFANFAVQKTHGKK